jgi:hypothetical protein
MEERMAQYQQQVSQDAVATDDAQLDATTGNNTTFMVILLDLKIV